MANDHPNTSGLIPLNQRPDNERTMIQSAGGQASARKRREIRRIKNQISGLRSTYKDEDPATTAIINLFDKLTDPKTSINDTIKVLGFIQGSESNLPIELYNSPIIPKID